jgi:hypothetical protein
MVCGRLLVDEIDADKKYSEIGVFGRVGQGYGAVRDGVAEETTSFVKYCTVQYSANKPRNTPNDRYEQKVQTKGLSFSCATKIVRRLLFEANYTNHEQIEPRKQTKPSIRGQ